MGYDETADIYTCHAGKELQPIFLKKQKSKRKQMTVYFQEFF